MTTPAAPTQYPFDTRPLTEPVDRAAVKQFTKEMRRRHPRSLARVLIGVFIAFVAFIVIVPMVLRLVWGSRSGTQGLLLPLFVLLAIFVLAVPVMIFAARKRNVTAFRLSRFAEANNMAYEQQVADPPLPGMIFRIGRSRKASSLLRGHSPRFVEFGNYEYTTGSGKNSTTHHWGYVAVKLDVPLPNIVLDALGNNTLGTNLPSSFSKDQRLSLEGDFDRHFTLYCPNGYEADALYLFTPDIMARFIDNAAQMDVEIVDDWMFLYTRRRVSTTDVATWAWLFSTVGALMTKFDQWARWRDDRLRHAQASAAATAIPSAAAPASTSETAMPAAALPFAPPAGSLTPPPGVAPEGRRLKKGVNWVFIIAIAAVVVVQLLRMFLN